ncbi:MAG: fumarylacetoacetate hydrolase family protein [Planctomycetota bacterium]
MKLAKFLDADASPRVGVVTDQQLIPLQLDTRAASLADILSSESPIELAESLLESSKNSGTAIPLGDSVSNDAFPSDTDPNDSVQWLPPIDEQEVWAAGVTYRRSQTARMEESEAAASCYDQVYNAERPEIFFKATAHRVAGHLQDLRIRGDATWNVPEPEITLVLSNQLKIVGLTIGNDMSSRDIEGENPLYLPQAKCYDQCAGLGPWVTLYPSLPEPADIKVALRINRGDDTIFEQNTSADQMAREFADLVGWLGRDNSFPNGAFLMTGTGIVPTNEFTLQAEDWIHISITGIGTLSNRVVQNPFPKNS